MDEITRVARAIICSFNHNAINDDNAVVTWTGNCKT